MLKIALCDDDADFISVMKRFVTQIFSDFHQCITITSYVDGRMLIDAVEKQGQIFDVLFLDVDMPVTNGFQTANRLRQLNNSFVLVFTTLMESDVREGYKYNAYRYVFKNNLHTEVREAVSGIISRLKIQSADDELVTFKYRTDGVFETVDCKKNDIICLRLDKSRRVTLRTTYSEYELLKKPLSEYQNQLQNDAFYLHIRYFLVNLNRVADIDRESFIMEDGSRIPLGLTKETCMITKERYMNFLEKRL